MNTIEYMNMIQVGFNQRLADWYANAKLDYGIDGEGECLVKTGEILPCGTQMFQIIVVCIEDGETTKYFINFCDEWRGDKYITEYLFDIWAEEGFNKWV